MTHIDKNIDTKLDIRETNERRVNQLIDLVEKHTRTSRHLEQHSNIANLNSLKHAIKLQEEREEQINHLKDVIINGHNSDSDLKKLKRNYTYTHNYLRHHEGHMDSFTLEKTKDKQKHREDQMKYLH